MKTRPILFSGPMVRALLDGTKTQTRRIAKVIPIEGTFAGYGPEAMAAVVRSRCPYGVPGDRLWVRETWAHAEDFGNFTGKYQYGATYQNGGAFDDVKRWKPSIHMPRAASRLTLEIVSVRVERLQDISEMDAFAEGIDTEGEEYSTAEHFALGGSPIQGGCPAVFAYINLWESIHGPGSWDANPWVWVVEFKRVEQ